MTEQNSNPMPFSSYLEDLKVNGASKSTLQHYKSVLTNANAFKELPDWNKDDVNKYFLSRMVELHKNDKSILDISISPKANSDIVELHKKLKSIQ